jgi:hypothetical protein
MPVPNQDHCGFDSFPQSVIQNFLEKGNFFNPSETLAKKSESCPPNNISVERVCGELDTKIKQAPNCVINTVIVTAETLSRNERGRFGALKSDSTHQFFRNACTKSWSLRF